MASNIWSQPTRLERSPHRMCVMKPDSQTASCLGLNTNRWISADLIHSQSKQQRYKPMYELWGDKCSQLLSTVAAKSCRPLTWHPYKPSILSMHTHHCCVGGWVRWRCEYRGWAGLLSHVRSPWSDRWSDGGHVSGHSPHWHHAGSSSSVLPPLEMLGSDCCFSKQHI